ncbi:delta-4 desaturase [Tribonema minus]|uniref:Delta-4 desaturase n=1 Tax=Tribonema minus TaxID=303371 RepID=A0A835YN02_9STRA|nr:delta-4 desaturase [Tribonema minus]
MCRDATNGPRLYTREEVAQAGTLAIVGSQVFDVAAFSKAHPGGAMFPRLFGGHDATVAFATYHGRPWPAAVGARYAVGELAEGEKPVVIGKDYMELVGVVAALLLAALAVEARVVFGARTLALSTLLGVLYAWIGLNVMHDANHGAVSRHPAVNRALGLAQDWIGGSSVLWVHQHVVAHHVHTNHEALDPDIQGFPLFRLYQNSEWRPHHRLQHLYFYCAAALFGVKVAVLDLAQLARGEWGGVPLSPLARGYWRTSVAMKVVFYLRFFALPLALSATPWATLAQIFWCATVCGGYLAFFFMLSHNFDQVATYAPAEGLDGGEKEYLRAVLETTSNVGGSALCFANGGLNYQIEHHLFPRVHHSHYPRIAPAVQRFCEERGLPYFHFATIGDNVDSMTKYLAFLGRA